MSYFCYNCKAEVALTASNTVARKEECPLCKADLHCCRNCSFYDEAVYNECREPQAERVLEKTRSNFCDYFVFASDQQEGASASKEKALQDLDALFK